MADVLHNTVKCLYGRCEKTENLVRGFCKPHHKLAMKNGGGELLPRKTAKKGEPLAFIKQHVGYQGDDCLIWPFAKYYNGYGAIRYDDIQTIAHRVMCRLAHGEPASEYFEASHTCECGHLGCINPNHLIWETHYENHQRRAGRSSGYGSNVREHGRAKLTPEQVLAIRADERPARLIAQDYRISSDAVGSIRAHQTWKWLKPVH
jgi:hypothetical protein